MKLQLSPVFAEAWQGLDAFAKVQELQGDVFRQVESRKTLRFDFQGKSYFAKIHLGVGWREIFKNLVSLRRPIISAANEWHAIAKLDELGVATMTAAGFGERGRNPAKKESFILTEELVNTVSLEEYCQQWPQSPPSIAHKRKLISTIARMSRQLHKGGVCHRDYYLCHFHLDISQTDSIKLYIIDLHRALIKRRLAKRWVLKDIAGLYFSAMDLGLTTRDLYRFMTLYSGLPLRDCLDNQAKFWHSVRTKALKLYNKH